MAAQQKCPLDPKILDKGFKMGLRRVKAIETHVTAAGNCAHPPLKELVLQGLLKDSTPLLFACAQGNLVVVKRIVERWEVDLNAVATYYHLLDDEAGPYHRWEYGIKGATLLFVAALNGHDHIVRYLIAKGADVSAQIPDENSWKYGGMTALHAALSIVEEDMSIRLTGPFREKKTAIVRLLLESGADPSVVPKSKFPIWMTNLCDSNTTAITALINSGMSLEQRNPYHGYTVLHHWAGNPLGILLESRTEEQSPLAVVKLLVEKGANLMALNNNGFTPILKAAHEFLAHSSRENYSILEYLLERDEIDRKEKIEAMELVGAVILSDKANAHLFETAFDYWRRALQLRQMEAEGSGPLLKIPMKRKSGLTGEWVSSVELEYVVQHRSEYRLQSFLTRLRIYSSRSFRAVLDFIDEFFDYEVPALKRKRKFADLLNMLLATLEMIVSFQPGQEDRTCWMASSRIIEQIVKILSSLEIGNPILNTETIKHSLELIFSVEQIHLLDSTYRGRIESQMRMLIQLVTMLSGNPEMINEENEGLLIELLRLKRITYNGHNLIHLACSNPLTTPATVGLLLKSGIDVNAGDSHGNGPLHLYLAEFNPGLGRDYSIIRLLLDSGAHLDRVNKRGKTAVDLWTEYNERMKSFRWEIPGVPQLDRLPDWCYENVPKLQCLSSRIIRAHKIHYTEETLPFFLHKFVEMH